MNIQFTVMMNYVTGYDSIDSMKKAVQSLRYMLLCKVMLGTPEEVQHLLSGKLALKYRGKNVSSYLYHKFNLQYAPAAALLHADFGPLGRNHHPVRREV